MPKCVESTWIHFLPLCQAEAALLELGCSAHTTAAGMLQSLAWQHHRAASQDGITLHTITEAFQSPQSAGHTAQQAGQQAGS